MKMKYCLAFAAAFIVAAMAASTAVAQESPPPEWPGFKNFSDMTCQEKNAAEYYDCISKNWHRNPVSTAT